MKRIIALFICLVLVTVSLTGCTNEEVFKEKNYTAQGEEITEIQIDVRDRQIEVMLSPDNQVHIAYFENSKEYYDISVSDAHTLTMSATSDKAWTDYIGGKSMAGSRKIMLQVPDTRFTLNLSTTNEDMSLSGLSTIEDISLSSQGGNIVFDKLGVENSINLSAKNGNITGTMIGSFDDFAITCNSKKGESNLPSSKEGGAKALNVSNNNGDIDIAFVSE